MLPLSSRRSVLRAMAIGAGAAAMRPFLSVGPALGIGAVRRLAAASLHPSGPPTPVLLGFQTSPPVDAVTARIQADLEKHASFGIKRSGTTGDLATAEWISQRLRTSGYKVDSHAFAAPFLAERSVRLSTEGLSINLYPQTPAATTSAKGITALMVLIRGQADAANTKGKIAL